MRRHRLRTPPRRGRRRTGLVPAAKLGWDGYRDRLVGQGPRWEAMGIDFYRSAQVPWE